MMRSTIWFVYILRLADETLYTGMTSDLRKRFLEHYYGKGAQYVKRDGKRPFRMYIVGEFNDMVNAKKFERILKNRSSRSRWKLIAMATDEKKEFEFDIETQIKLLREEKEVLTA